MTNAEYLEYPNYLISADKSLLSLDRIAAMLSRSYWADRRPREIIERFIANSAFCVGIYLAGERVAFARIFTDFVAIYWIGDVIVDESHRGRGLGKRLMQFIVDLPELQGLNGILSTRDAHGLYSQFGFAKTELAMMRRAKPIGVEKNLGVE